MAYKSTTIKEMVADIESRKMYLPALQRKFVWGKSQIELLFDSILRNFPIGTFLFWKLKAHIANNYVFYEFLTEYDQRDPYNLRKQGAFLSEIIGVLDGQQRLSSMYIGLQGTHTEKAPYKRWADENAYRKSRLYLNLLSLPYSLATDSSVQMNEEQNFEFRFLTYEECIDWISRKSKTEDENGWEITVQEDMFWFKVGDILIWNDDPDVDFNIDELKKQCVNDQQRASFDLKRRFIKKALETLHKRIISEPLINYFEIAKEELEDILKIFIRVNSGGTQLSKTDLLFSTIVATWSNGREEIETLIQKINNKGDKFTFTNEYLMRCCLVLTDAPVLFKVNSFKSENVQKIKDEWKGISNSIEETVDLLTEFGLSSELLTSQNATIIIAYYIFKGGQLDRESKANIKKYLIHALLNGIYGSSQDQLLTTLRNNFRTALKSESGKISYILSSATFSFEQLLLIELPSRKSLYITEVELDNFMTYKKGAGSFFILSLLYPDLRYKEIQFHQDHIHPAAGFTADVLDEIGIDEEEQEEWFELRDMVPNLQLLEGRQNESKNASAFLAWLSGMNEHQKNNFCLANFIPEKESLTFKDFKTFFEKRKIKLKNELRKVLAINTTMPLTKEEFLLQEGQAYEA